MQLRLPADKLTRLVQSLRQWRVRKSCTKRELLSLLGSLQHAAKVIKPGRAFIHRVIKLSKTRKHIDAPLRVNADCRSDIEWVVPKLMARSWNGVSILAPVHADSPDGEITSDASGCWGCGAFHGREWFHLQWDLQAAHFDISIKELLPIVMAAATWGNRWQGLTIRANCDNMAVVHMIGSHYSSNSMAMHLLRCLALLECSFQFTLVSEHIPGKSNDLADALSRNNLPYFPFKFPPGQPVPNPTPSPPVLYPSSPATGLDLQSLGDSVREYYFQGLAPATNRSYSSAKSRFIKFCNNINQPCLPVSESLLCHYIAYLANEKVSASTIKSYLSAYKSPWATQTLVSARCPASRKSYGV